jgi:uncharacterized protein (DUF427 family)
LTSNIFGRGFDSRRHYFPPEAIKVDLSISDTTYTCAYKGNASYYSANVNGKLVKDITWVYPNPTSKFEIKGRYAFDKAQVKIVSEPGIVLGNKL